MNYYNEWDEYAAQWLRNLIADSLIPAGHVDTRSIVDVRPSDLAGYRQCHFFAGVGGWSLAARLAGWPDDRELWTGSCPCQPFSIAGKGKAQADDRHLWPYFANLLRARRPAVVMGEQVAAAVGKNWIDGVFADLEGIGYAYGAVVVPACAVNAPHRRDRLWFVADCRGAGLAQRERERGVLFEVGCEHEREDAAHDVRACTLVDSHCNRLGEGRPTTTATRHGGPARATAWSDFRWIACHDGKFRRIQSGLQPLGNGFPARVGRLRAYGNAIVPQVAAEVIGAYMDCYAEAA